MKEGYPYGTKLPYGNHDFTSNFLHKKSKCQEHISYQQGELIVMKMPIQKLHLYNEYTSHTIL